MHTSYITSITSLRCKTSLSYSVSDYKCYYIHDRIPNSPCCSCCANSLNKISINPSFVYGLRQSSLIQCTTSRSRRLTPQRCSRFTICDIDPICYYQKPNCFEESSNGRRGDIDPNCYNWKPNYFEERSSNGRRGDIDPNCYYQKPKERSSNGRRGDIDPNCYYQKPKERSSNGRKGDIDANCYYQKPNYSEESSNGGRGSWRKGNYGRIVSEERGKGFDSCRVNDAELMLSLLTEEVSEECLGVRRRNGRLSRTSQMDKSEGRIKKNNVGSSYKCDYESVEFKEEDNRQREEERRRRERENENLRERKGGSSCSSYYSLSSLGEIDSDSEVHIKDDAVAEESSKERNGKIKYGREFEEEIIRDGGCNENQGIQMEKIDTTTNRVESDWRKKSEKKLTEVSIEQAESKKESSQKFFSSSEMNNNYDDKKRERKSSSALRIDDGRREKVTEVRDDVTRQSESKMKYNQVQEREHVQSSVNKASSSSEKQYRGRDDHKSDQSSTKWNEYQEKIQQRAKVSETKETDTTGTAEEHGKFGQEVTLKMNSKKKSQQSMEISDTHDVDIESTVISQRRSDMRLKKQEEASSSYQEAKEQQSQTDAKTIKKLESRKEAHDFITDAENITKSSYETRASSEEKGQTSSPQLQLEIHGESRRDGTHVVPSSFISHEDTIASADKSQQFATHFVSEFIEKAKKEISTSELEKVTSVTKKVDEESKQTGEPGSSDYRPKDRESGLSSRGSGAKGPSDEMWAVNNPSLTSEEPPEIEAPEAGTKEVVRRPGRSMWGMMSDIVRLRWGPRSETRSSRSGERSSPNQSTTTEAWFSGHEHDEYVSDTVKKEIIGVPQSVDQQQETGQSQRETSIESDFLSKGKSSSSNEESLSENLGVKSGTEISKLTTPLPAIRMRRSPVIEDISRGTSDASGSSTLVERKEISGSTSDASGSGSMAENKIVSGTENKDGEVKSRKLQRNKQVPKDRFDEWEEAFTVEMEQRKTDEMFMKEALLEAKRAGDMWEVPVGAVLVHHGKIIARGYNLVEELRDSTAHAEMICIREGSNVLQSWRLSETTLYVTLEPCPMCAGAILQARVDTVVWGAPNKLLGADGSWIRLFPNGGEEGNSSEPRDTPSAPVHPFHPNMKVRRGVLESECANVMREFFQLRRRKKEKKTEPATPPPSSLPISQYPSKFFTKMHHVFTAMFCL